MEGSVYIHKFHNVSVLLYHFVCAAKYRKIVFDKGIDNTLNEICIEISNRYEMHFLEIGVDKDHVHFLLQSIPRISVTKIIMTIKSIRAREIFSGHPWLKKKLWGGEFWSDGYFVNSVSKFGDEQSIGKYVRNQGYREDYEVLYSSKQLKLF